MSSEITLVCVEVRCVILIKELELGADRIGSHLTVGDGHNLSLIDHNI